MGKIITAEEHQRAHKALSYIINDLNAAMPETYKDLPESERFRTKETADEIILAIALINRLIGSSFW